MDKIEYTEYTESIKSREDTLDHEYEPPKKIMKYEYGWQSRLELIQFQFGYSTKKGNILLDKDKHMDENDTLLSDSHNKVYVLNFQTFEGGEAYLITNTIDNITNININKGYSINDIFNNFMKGYYKIGILNHYHQNCIITDISTFDNENNDEIRLHYTQDKSYKGNVAWRTITWDLFEKFVPTSN